MDIARTDLKVSQHEDANGVALPAGVGVHGSDHRTCAGGSDLRAPVTTQLIVKMVCSASALPLLLPSSVKTRSSLR